MFHKSNHPKVKRNDHSYCDQTEKVVINWGNKSDADMLPCNRDNCEYKFKTIDGLKKHINDFHIKMNDFKCILQI